MNLMDFSVLPIERFLMTRYFLGVRLNYLLSLVKVAMGRSHIIGSDEG